MCTEYELLDVVNLYYGYAIKECAQHAARYTLGGARDLSLVLNGNKCGFILRVMHEHTDKGAKI